MGHAHPGAGMGKAGREMVCKGLRVILLEIDDNLDPGLGPLALLPPMDTDSHNNKGDNGRYGQEHENEE